MKRLYPRRIHDKFYLSRLLERYLDVLANSPLQVSLRTLAYNSQIPESIFRRLANLHRNPADAANIEVHDYHVVFSNVLFRYPTVKMWLLDDGEVFFEL